MLFAEKLLGSQQVPKGKRAEVAKLPLVAARAEMRIVLQLVVAQDRKHRGVKFLFPGGRFLFKIWV